MNTSTLSDLCSVTVPAGTYIIVGSIGYSGMGSNNELISAIVSINGSAENHFGQTEIHSRTVQIVKLIKVDTETTFTMRAMGTGIVSADGRYNYLQTIRVC